MLSRLLQQCRRLLVDARRSPSLHSNVRLGVNAIVNRPGLRFRFRDGYIGENAVEAAQ